MATPSPVRLPPRRSASDSDGSANQRAKYAGKRLGKFQIVGELGRGGMGVVFEARDTVLERNVAIKLLPRSVANQAAALERFLREARAAAKLHHPHVVGVYDADQFNGQYYIVLELVRGGSLQEVLKTGPLPWVDATRVMADACRGLEVAHRAGLVHRDIKPSNLMRSKDGTVKLSDFGLARPNEPIGTTMTGSGSVLGTPQYMSPEQCRSERADERSDLYAMGATYYALLTGQPPYPGDAPLLVMNAHLLDPIPDPRDVDASIPEVCSAIIQRAMAKDPDERYANAAELIADLEQVLATAGMASGTSVLASSSPIAAATTVARAKTTQMTAPTSFVDRLDRRLASPPRGKINSAKVIALVSVVLLIGIVFGPRQWMATPGPDASIVRMPQANEPGTQLSAPAIALTPARHDNHPHPTPNETDDRDAFRLPGMIRDPQLSTAQRAVWSLSVPNLSRLSLANSGEFLVVLTNVPAKNGATWRGEVAAWDRNGTRLFVEEISGRATSVAISADSTRLAIGMTGGQGVLMWDARSWSTKELAGSATRDDVEVVALSFDGHWLAYSSAKSTKDGEWVLWDATSQREQQRHVIAGAGLQRAIEFAPGDELRVVTGGKDGVVRYWLGSEAELVLQTFDAGQPISAIALRPGAHLQATGYGKWFSLWNYQRNVRTFVRGDLPVVVDDVAFSPNGQLVAVSSGALVEILDADSGHVVETLTGFGGRVLSMAFSADGSELLAASANGKLTIWKLALPLTTAAR